MKTAEDIASTISNEVKWAPAHLIKPIVEAAIRERDEEWRAAFRKTAEGPPAEKLPTRFELSCRTTSSNRTSLPPGADPRSAAGTLRRSRDMHQAPIPVPDYDRLGTVLFIPPDRLQTPSMSRTSFRSIGFILSVVLTGAAGCSRPLALSKADGGAAAAHGGAIAVALDGATAIGDGGSSIGDDVGDAAMAVDVLAAIDASTGTTEVADVRLDSADGSPDAAPVHHGALAVAIGDAHACALRDDHTVRCWGEVAAADRGPSRPVVAIAAGGSDTCAILDDGSVTCWEPERGYTWSDRSFSPDLGPSRRAVSLAMSQEQWACAILDDATVRCWNRAWVGSGTEMTTTLTTTEGPLLPVRQLGMVINNATIALYDDGTISEGPDGLALTVGRLTPAGPAAALANDRGDIGWCALLVGGGVYCWGGGQTPPAETVLTSLAMAEGFSCGLRPEGTVSCWGPGCGDGDYWCKPGQNADRSYDVALGQPAVSVTTGTRDAPVACAVLVDGSIKCWSYSPAGECNDTVNGEGVCQAIVGASVEVVNTDAGLKYGAWHAIDLDDPP
jgi:hypothetical protein